MMVKSNFLRNILIVSIIAVIFLPLYTSLFLHPSFTKLLTDNTEEEAVHMGNHLASELIKEESGLKRGSISTTFKSQVDAIIQDAHNHIMKIRIFSPSGEIIFSTDRKEIGEITKRSYLQEIVAKGNTYTHFVKKDTKSLEDKMLTVDVVETYVPIMDNEKFAGAFEFYYDITERKEKLDKLVIGSSGIVFTIAFGLLVVITLISIKANRANTERKKADEEKQFLANIMDSSSQPFAVGLPDGTLVKMNRAFCELTGYSEEEILKDITWNETLTPPEWREYEGKYLHELLETKNPVRFEKEYIRKDGTRIPVELIMNVGVGIDGNTEVVYGYITDITELKKAEKKLKESEENYRIIVQRNPHGIQKIDIYGTIIYANKAHHEMYGYEEGALIGRSITDFLVSGSQRDELPGYLKMLAKNQPPPTPYYQKILTKRGKEMDIEVTWNYLRDTKGGVVGFLSVLTDITDRKKAEEVLRKHHEHLEELVKKRTYDLQKINEELEQEIAERKKSEEQLHKLSRAVEQSSSTVIITDTEGEIEYVNPKFSQVSGYSFEEVIGENPRILKSGEQRSEFYKELWDTIKSGGEWRGEFHNRKKNGELYWEYASISPVRNTEGVITHFLAVKEDITERKHLEKTIIEIEDRERRRIGMDLHDDIGQLLIGIALKSKSLELKLRNNIPTRAEDMEEITYLITKAIKQIKTVSMELSPIVERGEESLMVAMERLASYTEQIFKIPCVIKYDKPVMIQNETAVMQLYHIAQEAVTNAAKHTKSNQIEIWLNKEDDKITILVKDDGIGMPELPERTNGMGLSIMNYRANIIGASLDIQSEINKGTIVSCTFKDSTLNISGK